MAALASRSAPSLLPVADSDWRTLLIVCGVMAFVALAAFGLARLARLLPQRIPRSVLLVTCATLLPTALLVGGFAAFADTSLVEWVASRPPRAYRNVAILYAASLVGVWFGLRGRRRRPDPSTFD